MVLLHFKKDEANQFLYETTVEVAVEDLVFELSELNNARVVLDRLSVSIEELIKYGPMRPEAERGLTDDLVSDKEGNVDTSKPHKYTPPKLKPGERYNEDPTHYRTGVILAEETCKMIFGEVLKAKKLLNKENVSMKIATNIKDINEQIENLRGAIMIGYPAYFGLPEYEPVRMILEKSFPFEEMANEVFDWYKAKESTLWWAGKELFPGKLLKDYVGKNEKTKIVVKLQKKGQGAPVREPVIDQKSYTNMLSHYHKKQEEFKKLEEDNEDAYLSSAWADPKSLKRDLVGTGSKVSWRPK